MKNKRIYQKTKEIPKRPYRPEGFSFTESKAKFPKPGSLKENKNKIVALQFFANHELLAIEMMASAIILFCKTVNPEEFKTISVSFKYFIVRNIIHHQT